MRKMILKPPPGMPHKERLFCIYMMDNGGDIKQAVIDAGYCVKRPLVVGNRLMQKPRIKKYMTESMKEIQKQLGTDPAWKVQKLKECIEKSFTGGKNGSIVPSGIVGAIAELNKMAGDYEPDRIITKNETQIDSSIIDDLIKKNSREL